MHLTNPETNSPLISRSLSNVHPTLFILITTDFNYFPAAASNSEIVADIGEITPRL